MDNLTLAQKILGREKTTEQRSEQSNPSSASIVYMIAVTNSSGGEVVLKDELDETAEWEDGDFVEVDEDGEFEEYISEDDPLEDIDDTVVDMTDGDGVDIEGTAAEAVSFSVAEYHETAMAAYEEELDAVGDDLPDENASIDDTIDDGDAETIPDVGEDNEDALPDEDDVVDDLSDDEYTLADSDDESEDPITGAEISDGYTVAECIGSIKAGDRVAVMIQDGKPVVIGVVGSGDELIALMQHASEEAHEASEIASTAKTQAETAEGTANTAKQQADKAIQQAGEAERKANSASESATAASDGVKAITDDFNTVKTDASQTLAQAIEANTEKKVEKMTASFATQTDLKEQKIDLESEIERSAGKIKTTLSAEYARKTDLTEAKVEMQSAIEQTAEKISFSVSSVTDAFANTQNEEIKAQIAQAKANLETAKNQLESAKTTLNEAVANKDLAIANAAKAQNELSDAQATLAQAQKELTDAESYYDELVSIGASTEDIEQARADVQAAESAVTSATTAVAEAQSKATQAETAVTSATNAVNTAETNVNTAQANVSLAENGLHNKCMTAIEQTADSITIRATKTELKTVSDNLANNYYDKKTTDAQIKTSADAIKLSVSETYQTKDAMGNYSTTAQMNSAIEQKASSITSTVSSTYLSKTDASSTYSTKTEVTQTAEGLQVKITDSGKTATNYMSYDATNGLLIGNKTSGSWSGSRAQILPSAFNILDSSGNKIASYQSTRIDLGLNSTSAVIGLCGGKGTISYTVPQFFTEKNRLLIKSADAVGMDGRLVTLTSSYIEGAAANKSSIEVMSETTNGVFIYSQDSENYSSNTWDSSYIEVTPLEILLSSYKLRLFTESYLDISSISDTGLNLNGVTALHSDSSGNIGIGHGLKTSGANLWMYGNNMYAVCAGTFYIEDAPLYVDQGIRMGGDGVVNASRAIGTYWNDNAVHYILERASDGLTAAFGWAGSTTYKTTTVLRGQSCRLQNASGTVITSDERLKEEFTELDAWSDFYDALEPCAFKLKTGNSGRYHMGFKAQQVEKALLDAGLSTTDFAGFIRTKHQMDDDDPEGNAIYEAAGINDGDDELGLIYSEFTALNTWKIQKMQKRIDELEKLVEQLLPI